MCRWVIYIAIKLFSLLLSSLPFLVVDWSQEHRSILLDIGIGDNYKNKENGVKGFCFRRGGGNKKNWYTYGINDTNLIHSCCNLLRSLFDQFQTRVRLAGWDVGHRLSAFRLSHSFQEKTVDIDGILPVRYSAATEYFPANFRKTFRIPFFIINGLSVK